jgi:branched-chain amino acid transport system permease protein
MAGARDSAPAAPGRDDGEAPHHAGTDPAAAARARRLPVDRWRAAEIAFWLLVVAAFFLFPRHRVLGSQILITGLFAVSLDLILGYAGIVSLGHAAFFGMGAYTAGLLAVRGWGEPLSGLLAAGLVGALVGFATSFLVVRGSDLARLMVTLGIGLMLYEAANQLPSITGGADGLSGVTMGKVLGAWSFDLAGSTAYAYSAAVLFVLFVVARRIVASPFGLSLRGVRENVKRMPVIGAPVTRRLVAIYTISAAMAGVAGGLLAQTTQFVGLDVFGFPRSADLMIMVILGGAGRLYGGLIGAAVFMIAHHFLSDLNPIYWQFWLGLLLVVVVLFARNGILGALEGLRERMRGARS